MLKKNMRKITHLCFMFKWISITFEFPYCSQILIELYLVYCSQILIELYPFPFRIRFHSLPFSHLLGAMLRYRLIFIRNLCNVTHHTLFSKDSSFSAPWLQGWVLTFRVLRNISTVADLVISFFNFVYDYFIESFSTFQLILYRLLENFPDWDLRKSLYYVTKFKQKAALSKESVLIVKLL